MKKLTALAAVSLILGACVHESALPLGNNMLQVDVSTSPIYGRAGAQRIAMKKAAQATLDNGYDKFIVVNNGAWNESSIAGGSRSSFNANSSGASGSSGSGFSSFRHPESSLVIRMYHNGDSGAKNAIDAHKLIESKSLEAF